MLWTQKDMNRAQEILAGNASYTHQDTLELLRKACTQITALATEVQRQREDAEHLGNILDAMGIPSTDPLRD